MTYSFSVQHNGKLYQCEREVTGKRSLQQTITVLGVGSKEDSASYGQRGHPTVSMESIARIIAHEIIGRT
jgi:hypothetical protein